MSKSNPEREAFRDFLDASDKRIKDMNVVDTFAESREKKMKELAEKKEWRWLVTDYHEIAFALGHMNLNGDWYFKAPYYVIPASNIFLTEKEAVKFAKDSLKKIIAIYKDRLDKIKKRGV